MKDQFRDVVRDWRDNGAFRFDHSYSPIRSRSSNGRNVYIGDLLELNEGPSGFIDDTVPRGRIVRFWRRRVSITCLVWDVQNGEIALRIRADLSDPQDQGDAQELLTWARCLENEWWGEYPTLAQRY
jgi:hypothetical protein